jgi:hypothetical protein
MHSGYRRVLLTLGFGVVAATLVPGRLYADILVGGPGDNGDCIPFGCSDASVYQQIFDSGNFSGPITIAGLGFQVYDVPGASNPDTIFPATYHISFSIVSRPVNGLVTPLENNIDPLTVQDFFIGSIADPVSGQFGVVTTQPNYYNYDPSQGNLLMQIETSADFNDPTLTMFALVNSSSGGLFSSASDNLSAPQGVPPYVFGCPDGVTMSPCLNSNYGLVVDFLTPADLNPVPEPGSIWLLITASALIGCAGLVKGRRHGLKSTS